MQFIDLKKQYSIIREKVLSNIEAVLEHGSYILGPEVAELEKQLANYVGVKHCISVGSGTDGLLMALMAKGVGPGDAIITTPFTFVATAEVISLLGATPVFVDIDPSTFNIDPEMVEITLQEYGDGKKGNKHTTQVKGIIAVDIFGLPADYSSLKAIARKYDLFLIEDAAQAFGASYLGTRAGAFGDCAVTSFYPAKPLGGYGEGGAIFTDDTTLAHILSSIRNHGAGESRYSHLRVGINGRLDTIQAAVLLAKLSVFDHELELRRTVAQRYYDKLDDLFRCQAIPQSCTSAWAQFSISTPMRSLYLDLLTKHKIPWAIHYPKPLHLQPVYEPLGYRQGQLPVAETLCNEIFSLPMHPYLTEDEQERIVGSMFKMM